MGGQKDKWLAWRYALKFPVTPFPMWLWNSYMILISGTRFPNQNGADHLPVETYKPFSWRSSWGLSLQADWIFHPVIITYRMLSRTTGLALLTSCLESSHRSNHSAHAGLPFLLCNRMGLTHPFNVHGDWGKIVRVSLALAKPSRGWVGESPSVRHQQLRALRHCLGGVNPQVDGGVIDKKHFCFTAGATHNAQCHDPDCSSMVSRVSAVRAVVLEPEEL